VKFLNFAGLNHIALGKNKLRRFAELGTLERVFQPGSDFRNSDHPLKGNWQKEVFHNSNPIVVELGCGRGEYTVEMARMFPEKNFIGIDRKGARLWRGAKTSNEDKMLNTAFLRVQIEHLGSFFSEGELSEIWITFPDPQPQQSREKNRMTSQRFLDMYRKILVPNGLVHLKTDNVGLFDYTLEMAALNKCKTGTVTRDLYGEQLSDPVLQIKTTYEKRFLAEGMKINYLNFTFPGRK
jgi:tRNA (guanine-N7-)-methyltransferase